MSDLRTCRIAGCERKHARNLFCCKPHWYRLPKGLRDDVWLEDRDALDMAAG